MYGKDWGHELRSEPQTLRQSLNFYQYHSRIIQQVGGKIKREKQVYIYISYLVEEVGSGDFFQSHLQCKSARATFLLNSMFTEM